MQWDNEVHSFKVFARMDPGLKNNRIIKYYYDQIIEL